MGRGFFGNGKSGQQPNQDELLNISRVILFSEHLNFFTSVLVSKLEVYNMLDRQTSITVLTAQQIVMAARWDSIKQLYQLKTMISFGFYLPSSLYKKEYIKE